MTTGPHLQHLASALAIVMLAGGAFAPPMAANGPDPAPQAIVRGTAFHAGGLETPRGRGTPARVATARRQFAARAADEHLRNAKGQEAVGSSIVTAPSKGAMAAAAPAPGLSITAYSRYTSSPDANATVAASATDLVETGGGYVRWWPREDPPAEPASAALEAFLGLPVGEAGWDTTVAWDQRHGRWVVASTSWEYDEETCDQGFLVLAVSTGADPAGSWTRWRIPLGANSAEGISLGLSDELIAIGGNEYPLDPGWVACLGLPFSGARLRVMDWADALDGGTLAVSDVTPPLPRRSWSYRVARNVPVGDAPDAGADLRLIVDLYHVATGRWGNVGYGVVTGGSLAGTAALEVTDLTVAGTVSRLGGPPWMGAVPGYRILSALGAASGIDEAPQSVARRDDRLLFTAAASCTPSGETAILTCLRFVTLDIAGPSPAVLDDAMLAAKGNDLYLGGAGYARDGTALAVYDRGSVVMSTWRAAGEAFSTARDEVFVDYDNRSLTAPSWSSRAQLSPDPVDAGLAWITVPVPGQGLTKPAYAVRGGVSAAPSGTATALPWSQGSPTLLLQPATDSPITRVSVSSTPTTYEYGGYARLSNPSAFVSSRRLSYYIGRPDGLASLYVQWVTSDNIPSAVVEVQSSIDTTGPVVTGTRAYVVPQTLGSTVKVRWDWQGDDGRGIGVGSYTVWSNNIVERSSTILDLAPLATTTTLPTTVGLDYHVEIRATDILGNAGESIYRWAKTRIVQNTSTGVKYGGSWSTVTASSASGGSVRATRSVGATATITIAGAAFAIVMTKGPGRGKFTVSVDGGPPTTIDTYRSATAYRQVVWQTSFAWQGTHTVRIRTLGTSGRPRVDFDGFLVMEDLFRG